MSKLLILNDRAVVLDEDNQGSSDVDVHLDRLLETTPDEFPYLLSRAATGTDKLTNIRYIIIGGSSDTIYFKVSGDFTEVIKDYAEEQPWT